MHPVLIRSPHITSYAAFLVIGIVCGLALACWRARHVGIKPMDVVYLGIIVVVVGLIGAKILGWVFHPTAAKSIWDIFKIWEGSAQVLYGGLAAALVAGIAFCLARKISVPQMADLFAPSIALAVGLMRIGCFLGSCCWGDLCVDQKRLASFLDSATYHQVQTIPAISGPNFPLAVRFPANSYPHRQHVALGLISPKTGRSLPVHPVQLYEAVLTLALFILLNAAFRIRKIPGEMICAAGTGYGAIRFWTEFLRADNPLVADGLTHAQLASAIMMLLAVLGFWAVRRSNITRRRPPPRGPDAVANPSLKPMQNEGNM